MNSKLNVAGYVRLAIYILAALTGLAAVIVNTLGYSDLGILIGTVAGAGAAITGGTASMNLPKAPDQDKAGGFQLNDALPAILEIAEAARVYQSAVAYEGRHNAPEAVSEAPEGAEHAAMADYAASVRGE